MVNVSCKAFVALLVCFMMKECRSGSSFSFSSDSDSSVAPDVQCDRGFVRCKISGGEIGCVEMCNNSTRKCEGVDVDTDKICDLVGECHLPDTLIVEATETSLVVNCNFPSGGGSCKIVCFGSCGEILEGCGTGTAVPTCTGCTGSACDPVCTENT